MNIRYFAWLLLVIVCSGCGEEKCQQSCGSSLVTFVAIGYSQAELDSATLSTYSNNGTFNNASLDSSVPMLSCWQYLDTNSDTLLYIGYPEYTNDYEISIPAAGSPVYKISGITFAGQFSYTAYCPEGGTASGGTGCIDPAHLTSYVINGTKVTVTPTSSTAYYNASIDYIYLIK